MNHPLRVLARVRVGLALLPLLSALAALLSGCGPTTGGTGSGEGAALASFGAKAASTCSSQIARLLNCTSTSLAPLDPAQLAGTGTAVFVGSVASGPYVLTVTDNRAVFESRCNAARFDGEWGVLPSGDSRFLGGWVSTDRKPEVRAQLWPHGVAQSTDTLLVQVLDADGLLLFGPVQMSRVPAAPTDKPACP